MWKKRNKKFLTICLFAIFFLIVLVIAITLIYKEFLKNTKMSKMLLRIGFVKLLKFCLFSKVNQWNTKAKNWFMVIKRLKINFWMEKYVPQITLKESKSSLWISGNLSRFTIRCGLIWGLRCKSMLANVRWYVGETIQS